MRGVGKCVSFFAHPPLLFSLSQYAILSHHTGQSMETLDVDLARPKYLNPFEAINYGVIDRVLADDEDAARAAVKAATWNTDRA